MGGVKTTATFWTAGDGDTEDETQRTAFLSQQFCLFRLSVRSAFFSRYAKTGAVGGYSKTRVNFLYAPLEEGPLRRTLSIKFAAKDVADMTLDVTGACGDVPIYLESEEIDFKCCVYDQVRVPFLVLTFAFGIFE